MGIIQFINNKFHGGEKIFIIALVLLLVAVFGIGVIGELFPASQKAQIEEIADNSETILDESIIDFSSKEKSVVEQEQGNQLKLESVEPIKYSDLTDEQLQGYFNVYEDFHVIHLRNVLDSYLNGDYEGMDKDSNIISIDAIKQLDSYNKDYYKSGFIVLYINNSATGGKFIDIIFQDKPDKVFKTWIYDRYSYEEDISGEIDEYDIDYYNLIVFQEYPKTEEEMEVLLKMYKNFIADKEHAL